MHNGRLPWTRDELDRVIPKIDKELAELENENPNARALPPMEKAECERLFFGLLDIASNRALTGEECFMFGQALCCFRMAIMAEMLGKKGRYFVLSEADINGLMASHQNAQD